MSSSHLEIKRSESASETFKIEYGSKLLSDLLETCRSILRKREVFDDVKKQRSSNKKVRKELNLAVKEFNDSSDAIGGIPKVYAISITDENMKTIKIYFHIMTLSSELIPIKIEA